MLGPRVGINSPCDQEQRQHISNLNGQKPRHFHQLSPAINTRALFLSSLFGNIIDKRILVIAKKKLLHCQHGLSGSHPRACGVGDYGGANGQSSVDLEEAGRPYSSKPSNLQGCKARKWDACFFEQPLTVGIWCIRRRCSSWIL